MNMPACTLFNEQNKGPSLLKGNYAEPISVRARAKVADRTSRLSIDTKSFYVRLT